jgi:hypothetical protein
MFTGGNPKCGCGKIRFCKPFYIGGAIVVGFFRDKKSGIKVAP